MEFLYLLGKKSAKKRKREKEVDNHQQSPCPTCQSLLVTGIALSLDWPTKALWQIAVLVFAISVDWSLVCFLGHSYVLRSILALHSQRKKSASFAAALFESL